VNGDIQQTLLEELPGIFRLSGGRAFDFAPMAAGCCTTATGYSARSRRLPELRFICWNGGLQH
jgi:hypothetical protein